LAQRSKNTYTSPERGNETKPEYNNDGGLKEKSVTEFEKSTADRALSPRSAKRRENLFAGQRGVKRRRNNKRKKKKEAKLTVRNTEKDHAKIRPPDPRPGGEKKKLSD